MSTTLLIAAAVGFLGLVALAAYSSGRRRGRVSLPASLVTELREHKLHCIGEPPERVNLELALLCESTDSDAQPLISWNR
jgi:hypothetical protein